MEFFLNREYRLNYFSLSMIGLWPYQSAKSAWICRMVIFSALIYAAIAQGYIIWISELTIDFIIDVSPIAIPTIGAIFQFGNCIWNNKKMKDLLDQIKWVWQQNRFQNEIKIMQTYTTSASILIRICFMFTIICLSIYIFMTMIPQILDALVPLNESRSREHPFKAEFFIDGEKYFYVIRFFMYFVCALAVHIYLANGTMFLMYMQHACGMFEALGHRAERLFSDYELLNLHENRIIREVGDNYANIILFIEDHRNAIQFAGIIQSCYDLSLFNEWFFVMILTAFIMTQLITESEISHKLFRNVMLLGGQTLYLFTYSYMGQQLMDISMEISTKAYYGNWHNMSIWKQKLMLFVIMRCMRAITINVLNLYILCLESFITVAHMIISLFMLLKRLSNNCL